MGGGRLPYAVVPRQGPIHILVITHSPLNKTLRQQKDSLIRRTNGQKEKWEWSSGHSGHVSYLVIIITTAEHKQHLYSSHK